MRQQDIRGTQQRISPMEWAKLASPMATLASIPQRLLQSMESALSEILDCNKLFKTITYEKDFSFIDYGGIMLQHGKCTIIGRREWTRGSGHRYRIYAKFGP